MADSAAPVESASSAAASSTTENAPASAASSSGKVPTVILMMGMAGAGKTLLMQRLNAELRMRGKTPYVVNLDPAVATLPYSPNIDIRDTVNYKQVMKQYELGPNGAIVTSLNLFATRFDQVVKLIEAKKDVVE
jgi:GTPase SAR1 family protein